MRDKQEEMNKRDGWWKVFTQRDAKIRSETERKARQINRQIEKPDGQIDRQMDIQIDRWIYRQIDGWIDRWID